MRNLSVFATAFKMLTVVGLVGVISCNRKIHVDKNLTGFPQVTISTHGEDIENDSKIPATMSIEIDHKSVFNGLIGIEYRGASSFDMYDKKSFGIETRNAAGGDVSVSLFGFPEEEDWILHGPFSDKTLLRNLISFEISNQMGRYAPRTRMLELYINDEYLGVYMFTEKIKRNTNRVSVTKMKSSDVDSTRVTGGYILKIDKTAGDNATGGWWGQAKYTEDMCFRSDYDPAGSTLSKPAFKGKGSDETYLIYEYPDAKNINNNQKKYIQQFIKDFETALAKEDFSTPLRQYEQFIDVDSFVDYFILTELSHNPDGYRLSTYLHKDRGAKIKMGPIWDMDLCYGNDEIEFRSSPSTWIYQYNKYSQNDFWLVPFWWTKLLQDPLFKVKVKLRWTTLRSNVLAKENIFSVINNNVSALQDSGVVARNFKRWDILGKAVAFNGFVGETYEDEISYLKTWIEKRLTWMDSEISKF